MEDGAVEGGTLDVGFPGATVAVAEGADGITETETAVGVKTALGSVQLGHIRIVTFMEERPEEGQGSANHECTARDEESLLFK